MEKETCCLDIAEGGGASQQDIAQELGTSWDSIRMTEMRALAKLRVLVPDRSALRRILAAGAEPVT